MDLIELKDFPNYFINKQGEVFSNLKKDMRKLKTRTNKYGYVMCNLTKYPIQTQMSLHRLIAITFIPNPLNKEQVNHINGNKGDNRIENLEWVTHTENMRHAKTLPRLSRKPLIRVVCIENNILYNSAAHAARCLYICPVLLRKVLKNREGNVKGYTFRYVTDKV